MGSLGFIGLLLLLSAPRPAAALALVHVRPPIKALPLEQLRDLAPILRSADLALVESDAKGAERQVTVMTLVAAAPEVVREVVIHPERYDRFARNMATTSVTRRPDGTVDHGWKLSYGIVSFSGVNRYSFDAPSPEHPVAPVRIVDPTGYSHYQWEFLPARHGGGTILVLYGYTDVRHSGGLIDKILARAPTLEHGLALTTEFTMLLAVKEEAQRRHSAFPPYSPPPVGSRATSYGFMLERGLVALVRSLKGRLSEVSLVDRTSAKPATLLRVAADPARWSSFVPSISLSRDRGRQGGFATVELEQGLPLMSWTTRFGVRAVGSAVDMLGLDGDLRGARLRWDVRPGEVVLRTVESFDRSSLVMRQLYKIEPLFEYGVNVGMGLVILRAVKEHAEQVDAAQVQGPRRAG